MKEAHSLIGLLQQSLKGWYCSEFYEGKIGFIDFLGIIHMPRRFRFSRRNYYAFLELPHEIQQNFSIHDFIEKTRKSITSQFKGIIPLLGELRTDLIIFSDNSSYDVAKQIINEFVDNDPFHRNYITGIYLINKTNFDFCYALAKNFIVNPTMQRILQEMNLKIIEDWKKGILKGNSN